MQMAPEHLRAEGRTSTTPLPTVFAFLDRSGDTVTFKVKLVAPVALEAQTRFAVREGGKTVGAGVVTKIIA